MNSENSRTSKPHAIHNLTHKIDLRKGKKKSIVLSNLSTYQTWTNIKSSHNINKFNISAPIWNDRFELPDGSYSV